MCHVNDLLLCYRVGYRDWDAVQAVCVWS